MAKDSGFDQAVLVQVMPTSLASFLEFFILCWCGEEIQHGFQQVHTSIYDTNWYEAPLREKKSMTIVLEFSKNTIQLTGFTVFKADLKTFVESMRQSFSLYTLLQKLV
nr:olfactory receptor [Apolygus lucorum]